MLRRSFLSAVASVVAAVPWSSRFRKQISLADIATTRWAGRTNEEVIVVNGGIVCAFDCPLKPCYMDNDGNFVELC